MKGKIEIQVPVDTHHAIKQLRELERRTRRILIGEYRRGFLHGWVFAVIGTSLGIIIFNIVKHFW